MAWFKVDDKLWGHPKWLSTPMRARGLWVSAGSWSAANETDGKIPRHVLRTLGGTTADAKALVDAGLWKEARAGWIFHEWGIYQPDAASLKAGRQAASTSGEWGNHQRWHVKRSVVVSTCSYCQDIPPIDEEPPQDEDEMSSGTRSGMDRGTRIGGESSRPEPEPEPTRKSLGGTSPKQADGKTCPHGKPLGSNCGGCADARRAEKQSEVDKEIDGNRRTKAADARARQEREAEAARTLAELEADPDAPKRGLAQARAALNAARTTTKEET